MFSCNVCCFLSDECFIISVSGELGWTIYLDIAEYNKQNEGTSLAQFVDSLGLSLSSVKSWPEWVLVERVQEAVDMGRRLIMWLHFPMPSHVIGGQMKRVWHQRDSVKGQGTQHASTSFPSQGPKGVLSAPAGSAQLSGQVDHQVVLVKVFGNNKSVDFPGFLVLCVHA